MTASDHGADVALIVAVAENGVIGNAGGLPWRLSSDLKRFRQLTMGKPVIMGRLTYQSIGKPLDGRDNIVISSDAKFGAPGIDVVSDIDTAVARGRELAALRGASEVMVIGGARVYAAALPLAERVYWTTVHGRPEGDTVMAKLDPTVWREISRQGPQQGARDQYSFTYLVFERDRQRVDGVS